MERPVTPCIGQKLVMRVYDTAARTLIRRKLLHYMQQNAVGVPALALHIAEAAKVLLDQVPVKTLQRFLADEGRTNDVLVDACAKLAARIHLPVLNRLELRQTYVPVEYHDAEVCALLGDPAPTAIAVEETHAGPWWPRTDDTLARYVMGQGTNGLYYVGVEIAGEDRVPLAPPEWHGPYPLPHTARSWLESLDRQLQGDDRTRMLADGEKPRRPSLGD